MLTVEKYGGTSIADQSLMDSAADHVAGLAKQGQQVVVVVSAQGHTTDALVEQARTLGLTPRQKDQLLATGELQSAEKMAMTLLSRGVAAVSLSGIEAGIHTDGRYGEGKILDIDTARIRQALERGKVVVVAGFQGDSGAGDFVTLGRGGSDTTAVALAAWLGAADCRIFTDVEGVYDRDPNRDSGAKKYDRISYEDMLSLIDAGAQVLHRPCVELAQQKGLKLWVGSAFTRGPGTTVGLW